MKELDKKIQDEALQWIQQEEKGKKKKNKKKKKPTTGTSTQVDDPPPIVEPSVTISQPTNVVQSPTGVSVSSAENVDTRDWEVSGQRRKPQPKQATQPAHSKSASSPSRPSPVMPVATPQNVQKPAWGPGSHHFQSGPKPVPISTPVESSATSELLLSDLQDTFSQQHPRVAELDLHWTHLVGHDLNRLSMSQLEALEEMHLLAIQTINRYKVEPMITSSNLHRWNSSVSKRDFPLKRRTRSFFNFNNSESTTADLLNTVSHRSSITQTKHMEDDHLGELCPAVRK